MTELDKWLKQATRGLSEESAAQVRREISDHYESAREADERSALSSLGDARTANRQYRRVLLTSSEARLLGDDNVETWALRLTERWLRWTILALSIGALAAAAILFNSGVVWLARWVLAAGVGTIFWLAVPLLPIDTPKRGRVFRGVKWLVRAGTLLLAFGPGGLEWYPLIVLFLVQLSWTEWRRASIRRKLPAQQWPKHLYL